MPQQKLNIFLVDDDKIYQFTAKKTLESMGVGENISVYFDGQQAIQFIQNNLSEPENLPDVIFLDINMPVMDGWQFVDEFRKLNLPKKIRLYMVSSSVDEADVQRSRQYAVIEDYIMKPVGRNRFQELLTSLGM